MGRVAAVLYAPMMNGKVVSWDHRLKGRSVLDLNKIISSFFDELDPMSKQNSRADKPMPDTANADC